MSATIYEKTPGGLYATGARTVNIFPSGLVRVDQVYACKDTEASAHRAASLEVGSPMPDGDSAPAIDGMYLFPDTQELRRGDGLTEFRVSGFGRTRTTLGRVAATQQKSTLPLSQGNLVFRTWEISGVVVVPVNEIIEYEQLGVDPSTLEPFGFQFIEAVGNQVLLLDVEAIDERLLESPYQYSQGGEYKRRNVLYSARFTEDGLTASRTVQVWISDPFTKITGQRNFGQWTELDVVTEREFTFQSIA